MPNPALRPAAIAMVAALMLTACTRSEESSSPIRTSSGTTPTASAVSPTSSSPSSTQPSPTSASDTPMPSSSTPPASTTDAKLLAQAVEANRMQFVLESTVLSSGGLPPGATTPPEFEDVMMGRALELTMQVMFNTYDQQVRKFSGMPKQYGVRPIDQERDGSLIALRSCRDGRAVVLTKRGKKIPGILIQHTSYYKRDRDGRLKMSSWSSKEVPSC